MQCQRLDGHCPAGKKSPELRRGASLFLPPAREDVSKLTGEGEGSKPWTKQVLAASFSLITPGVHTGELPPLGEAQTVDKVGLLSSRTSDRCHWCGDPHPKSLENTAFLKKNGLPRRREASPDASVNRAVRGGAIRGSLPTASNDMFGGLSTH